MGDWLDVGLASWQEKERKWMCQNNKNKTELKPELKLKSNSQGTKLAGLQINHKAWKQTSVFQLVG